MENGLFVEREQIEEIRAANDITNVVSGYVRLKRQGNSLVGLCPFHNEKTPSFHVMGDRQSFHCFGCGVGGNVITFLMMVENYDFLTAVKALADRANISVEGRGGSERAKLTVKRRKELYEIHQKSARFFYDCLKSEIGAGAVEYIDGRGLSQGVRIKCGIGYSPKTTGGGKTLYGYLSGEGYGDDILVASGLVLRSKTGGGFYDRFFDRLMFPIFDVQGRVVGFGGRTLSDSMPKYLNSPETLLFEKSKLLYGLNFARSARKREFIVVEGYMDAISMYQYGFMNTVATLGTAFTPEHARLLKNYADRVILLYDSDEAGVKAVYRSLPNLIKAGLGVRVAQTGEEKDPDDFLKKHGPENMGKLLERAKNHIEFRIDNEKSKFDFGVVEQRVAFTKEAAKIFRGVSSEIERDAYIKETARLTGISEDAIRSEANSPEGFDTEYRGYRRGSIALRDRREGAAPKNVISAQKRLLGLIASNEAAFAKSLEYVDETDFTEDTYKELYRYIVEFRREGKMIRPEEVTSYFESAAKQVDVYEILSESVSRAVTPELEKDFKDQIVIIKRYRIERRRLEFLEKDDKEALQNAMKQQKTLESLYISLSDG